MTQTVNKCFVIMPFGIKPLSDGSGRTYDCNKVYTYLIKRAIAEAGLHPIRADEQTGSHIIHSEMFKELRDSTIVLADLSLENPNVYYELGIRHVLAPSGTVLICREGTALPFDVKLSRVIFYRYDGTDFDWQEVEQKVSQLTDALKQARNQLPDSPVHAFLANVTPRKAQAQPSAGASASVRDTEAKQRTMREYQQIVARNWMQTQQPIEQIVFEHGRTVFGARALGELVALQPLPFAVSSRIAGILFQQLQHLMVCSVFETMAERSQTLSIRDLLTYGCSISEVDPTIEGAQRGEAVMIEAARRLVEEGEKSDDAFSVEHELGGIAGWKFHLGGDIAALDSAIEHTERAWTHAKQIMTTQSHFATGEVSLVLLRAIIFHRMRDSNPMRPDTENYRGHLLDLDESRSANLYEANSLRWRQAIALADLGDEFGLQRLINRPLPRLDLRRTLSGESDSDMMDFQLTRRFIETNLPYLRNHTLMASLSQTLQYADLHKS